MATDPPLPALPPGDAVTEDARPYLSVVIPVFDEEPNIPGLYAEITAALAAMTRPYEVIAIDDGSRDGSFAALAALAERDPRWRIVRFRKNFGQTPAFTAGFDLSLGEWIVTLDADLQNDPADIPMLLAKAEEGYDVVSGWRVRRKDTMIARKLPSKVANWLIAHVTGVTLHDYGCSLKVYHTEVVKNVRLYGELHRFVPAVASSMGIRLVEVPVNHRPRELGTSKYTGFVKTISRATKVFLDLLMVRFLLSYSTRPLHIFGTLGLSSSGIGFLLGLRLTYEKLVLDETLSNRPLLTLAVLLIIVGVQFLSMGLLGELVVRTYHETQNKPIYAIRTLVQAAAPGRTPLRRTGH